MYRHQMDHRGYHTMPVRREKGIMAFDLEALFHGLTLRQVALLSLTLLILLSACGGNSKLKPSQGHFLHATPPQAVTAPGTMGMAGGPTIATPPMPMGDQEEVYTITVTEMPVRDLLFAMARDANMNIDIYPGITGRVTLSAINQSLPQILDRIANQVDLRYEIKNGTIIISPDRPYLKIYQVDYVNMSRKATTTLKVSTQLSTGNDGDNPLGQVEQNQSSTTVTNESNNQFWTTLTSNIQAILEQYTAPTQLETSSAAGLGGGSLLGGGSPTQATVGAAGAGGGSFGMGEQPGMTQRPGIVAVNPETGLISIFASQQQHSRIQTLLESVLESAQRQVLIESTVVEVELNDRYQEGVDWNQVLERSLNLGLAGNFVTNTITNSAAGAQMLNQMGAAPNSTVGNLPFFTANFLKSGAQGAVNATVNLLQHYGKVKVLSSPKITALNNQTAVMKVVENRVFFTMEATATNVPDGSGGTTSTALYNTKVHTVPVGLVMSVTPQIGQDDVVNLNVRPTISRISNWVTDPNPGLQAGNTLTGVGTTVANRIPEIRVREMESMLRIQSGQVAVMGGLMQDKVNDTHNGVPVLSTLPVLGGLFGYKDQLTQKTELVIFLRPVVTTVGRARADQGPTPHPAAARQAARQDPVGSAWGTHPAPAGGSGSYLDFTQGGNSAGMIPPPVMPAPPASGEPLADGEGSPEPEASEEAASFGLENGGAAMPAHTTMAMPPTTAGMMMPPPAMPMPAGSRGYVVDLGSYLSRENADRIHQQAAATGLPVFREEAQVSGRTFLRIRSGPYASQAEADQASAQIRTMTGLDAHTVAY